jgi:hypothetical protein
MDLISEAKGELVKGKKVHIEQRAVLLNTKEPFEASD